MKAYRKKILFISDNFPPETNAAASRVYERAVYWKNWNIDFQILTSFPNRYQGKSHPGYANSLYKRDLYRNINTIRVKTFVSARPSIIFRTLHQLSFMITSFIGGLFEKKINVVIVTTPQFFCSISGLLLSKIKRVPIILEIADIWSDAIKGTLISSGFFFQIIRSFETFIYNKSDALVVLTKGFKEEIIKRGIDKSKIYVIRNGVNKMSNFNSEDSETLKNKLNLNNKKIIGYMGAHGYAQDLENVIKAAKILEDANPNIVFLFLGDGDEKTKLKKLSKGSKNILFLKAVSKAEIPNYLSLFTIGLTHLKNEKLFENTIPSKIFEMMSAGLPILLVSPKGEASDIVLDNDVGIWVPAGNPSLLAEEISNLLEFDDDLLKFSKNSLNKSSLFKRDRQAKEMLKVVDIILN